MGFSTVKIDESSEDNNKEKRELESFLKGNGFFFRVGLYTFYQKIKPRKLGVCFPVLLSRFESELNLNPNKSDNINLLYTILQYTYNIYKKKFHISGWQDISYKRIIVFLSFCYYF